MYGLLGRDEPNVSQFAGALDAETDVARHRNDVVSQTSDLRSQAHRSGLDPGLAVNVEISDAANRGVRQTDISTLAARPGLRFEISDQRLEIGLHTPHAPDSAPRTPHPVP